MLLSLVPGYALLGLISTLLIAEGHPHDLSLPPALASEKLVSRATVCNGHAELCDRSFGSVTFVGAHDSYAIGVNSVTTNQDQTITQQLNDGIRMLQMQAHNESGVIRLCHTSCSLFDGGTLQDYLTLVKQWLDANPNEVLSLLIVNIDNLPATNYGSVFQAVGLDAVSFAPPSAIVSQTEWPTLGSLIDSGKRLLTFLDNGADLTTIPYLIDEFTNIWETEFNVIDPSFNCDVNRTKNTDPSTQMFLVNHFLDKLLFGQPVPFVEQLNVTNSASGPGSLGAQVDTCKTDHGRPPNFMLVDFYEFGAGSVFQVAAGINGVAYAPSTPVATPKTSASTSSGASNPTVSVSTSSLSGGPSTIPLSPAIALLISVGSFIMGSYFIV